jgi:exosortase/archaeosortase family protein
LTLNEELHLQRLLDSIHPLKAKTFVLDSGSSDQTCRICRVNGVEFMHHDFDNHPKQWHAALNLFNILTPWVICLDADQAVSPQLLQKLTNFKAADYTHVRGIYFNRKYYFKGTWIKHGGYYPKYLLKMLDRRHGHSDLQENMDHRFLVSGNTLCWKEGYLLEENLKENSINFWIAKHNTYSDLLAQEELDRRQNLRRQSIKPNLFGTPDEKNAWQKRIWWQLPLYLRPFLYFSYRMIFQLGILDGKTGLVYHFLQSFWFRLVVDIKIREKMFSLTKPVPVRRNLPALSFMLRFLFLFACFYGFHKAFIGLSTPGGSYWRVLDQHVNYIKAWRHLNIQTTARIIDLLGYEVQTTETSLRVSARAGFILIYSCLGYGIMSLTAAFILAYPKSMRSQILFLFLSLSVIQATNIARLVLIALYAKIRPGMLPDHHTLYNILIYLVLSLLIYLWLNHSSQQR